MVLSFVYYLLPISSAEVYYHTLLFALESNKAVVSWRAFTAV
jgi:hypothetical protein